jgi:hypothetical protein
MLTFHAVEIDRDLNRDDPLYVGNFFDLKRMWWRKRKQRQGLILSMAVAWYRLIRRNPTAPGFINEELFITSLTRQVGDARVILERFFDVTRIGFNFGDGNKSATQVSPKKLDPDMVQAIANIIHEVRFTPGPPPTGKNMVKSEVVVAQKGAPIIRLRLKDEGREDLIPAVEWLFKQDNPVTFYYERAGTLLARDKSVWPIKSIEGWPGWLRAELFGTVIDIENAYIQFVMQKLEEKYKGNPKRLLLKYPDLVRADKDKHNFRNELCKLMKLEPDDEGLSAVKRLLMALANGSNVTPALLTNGSGRSTAVQLVHEAAPDLLPSELIVVGNRLSAITKQLRAAKRDLCIHLLKEKPSSANQKKIFKLYFDWERESRYAIWNAVGKTGLMLHDGVDGIISDKSEEELVTHIAQQTSLRVSVEKQAA